jgi:hypothetical protein
MFQRQNRVEQAALVKTLVSNCRFDRGSLSVVYTSPFDMLARGNESGDWLGDRDSNRKDSQPTTAAKGTRTDEFAGKPNSN